jgi:hypothetical protein
LKVFPTKGISIDVATSPSYVVVVVEILIDYYVWNSFKTKHIVVEEPTKGTISIAILYVMI